MPPLGRWEQCVQRNAFGQFQREEVRGKSVDRAGAPGRIPKTMFYSKNASTTLPKSFFDEITGRLTWQKLQPAVEKNIIPCALSLMMHISESDGWDKIGDFWVALLLRPMDIARLKASRQCHMVMSTFQYGFIGWRVTGKRLGGRLLWTIETGTGSRPEFVHFADMAAIEVYPTEVAAPTHRLAQTSALGCVCLHSPQRAVSALERAAGQALVGMTDYYLRLLLRKLDLLVGLPADAKPKTTLDRVAILIRYALHSLTANEVWELLHKMMPVASEKPLIASHMEACTGVLELHVDRPLIR